MEKNISLLVDASNDKIRLDQFISKRDKELSRTKAKDLILKKKVKVNNEIIQSPSFKISKDDLIILAIPKLEETYLRPYKFPLDIIYEDAELIIINKPSGISMHPGAGDKEKTLVNALINYNSKNLSSIGDNLRPGIVHRLDKETSGLVVIAKNNLSHEKLSSQFSDHSIKRKYLTLIWGKLRPSKGKIETFIKRSNKNRQLMEVSLIKGKRAVTKYNTIEVFENDKVPTMSLVECQLKTGRTHQIRVHLSYKGNNVVGDKKYKKRYKKIKNINKDIENVIINLNRNFLHAKSLGFKHPTSNKELIFSSNLPDELENIIKKLRNSTK